MLTKRSVVVQGGALAIALVAVPWVGSSLLRSNRPAAIAAGPVVSAQPNDDEPQPHATRVEVVKPKPGGMERTTTQQCTVHAFEYEEIKAKVSGYLKEQSVDIGSRVKKGQVLATIDAPELEKEVQHTAAAVEQAEAQVKQADARIVAARAEWAASEKRLSQRKVEVRRAKAFRDYRQIQYNRYKDLNKQEAVELKLVDEYFENFEAAQAGLDAANEAVETAKADVLAMLAKIEQATADKKAAEANVGVARANLEKAKVIFGFTKIVSDYDGIVTQRTFHNGDFIRQADKGGEQPLLVVQRTDLMRVIVRVPDDDVPYADAGDPVDLDIRTLADAKFLGLKLARVSYSQDEKTRTMRVEVDVPNPEGTLRDGMFGYVTIHLQKASPKAFTIPSACLVHPARRHSPVTVFVVRDGVARRVPVHVGTDDAREVEILGGLKADDMVVSEHYGPLADGTPVELETDQAAHHPGGNP